ncbi:YegP family protein [Arthrobacter sp. RHLT1-20]
MAGKFEVYKDKSGGFRFRLKASNGEVIASSQSYKSKASALGGVESVKKNAASDVVDLTEEAPGSIAGVTG